MRVSRCNSPARRAPRSRVVAMAVLGLLVGGCAAANAQHATTDTVAVSPHLPAASELPPDTTDPAVTTSAPPTVPPSTTTTIDATHNVYAHASVGQMSPAVASAKAYAYVPSNDDGSVTVIDQATMQIVDHYKVGKLVQHVVADWDLRTLYATASDSNQLVTIDPTTGAKGKSIPIAAPYNLYFTPDGSKAVVMAERRNRIDYYDRVTWKRIGSTPTGRCRGVNHADWSADGSFFLATCEFSGDVIKVDTNTGKILNRLALAKGAMPQDLRLAPNGTKFYTADMEHGCVWIIDATGTSVIGEIATGKGAHGIYPSRDARLIYVTNRGRLSNDTHRHSHEGDGSISVVDPATDQIVATWQIPGGGSPDMGGVSADGSTLWISGRYDSVVYVFDTHDGTLKTEIPVPPGPHGLCLFPQPGRFSLGHTGNYR